MNAPLLAIQDLAVAVGERQVLRGVSLRVQAGEVHAIMGPNASGKSTLASVLAGKPGYSVKAGSVHLQGQDLMAMEPHARARLGFFLAFQYPVEIPGVSNLEFLKAAHDQMRIAQGLEPLSSVDFVKLARTVVAGLQLPPDLLKRGVNEGFSGGEKKRNEIVQLTILAPLVAVLDETDSGLDIDALRVVADGINQMRTSARGFLIITHYQRLLEYVRPDYVHVLADGRIVRSGDHSLALELERTGYGGLAADST